MSFEEIYNRFDPEGAPPSEWRADRPRSPAQGILDRLELSIGDGRFLLLGTVGTGKSTELRRIAEQRAARSFVVQLDLVTHFEQVVGDREALQTVKSWEVVFLAALAVARAAQERVGIEPVPGALDDLESAWKRAASKSEVPDAAEAQVDLAKLMKSMVILASTAGGGPAGGVAAAALLAPVEALELPWSFKMGRAKRALDDQNEDVRTLVKAANVIIGNIEHQHKPVLLVLDGLDRVEDRAAALGLFRDSTIISKLQCQSVVCAPFVLRHDPNLATVLGFEVEVLVNEPVVDFDDPLQQGAGVEFMRELFECRTHDLEATVDPAIVDELAYRSGGRARDFVKLVRELAAMVRLDRAEEATEEHMERALKRQRLLLEVGLTADHIQVLKGVMDDPRRRPPAGDIGYELLRTSKLLPYPDGSTWYFPHALLLRGQLLK